MLGKNTKIESIDNLYDEHTVLECFDRVEFESLNAFINGIRLLDNYVEHGQYIVNIHSQRNYNHFVDIITKTRLRYSKNIYIRCSSEIYNYNEMVDRVGVILTDKEPIIYMSEWNRRNPVYREIKINKGNYDSEIRWMTDPSRKNRHFIIEFDFESFDKMKFEELHKLEFWINYMKSICNKYDIKTNVGSTEIIKSVFLANDNKLYFTRDKEKLLFDIEKYRGKKGNDIPYKELNWLRGYIDMNREDLYFPFNRNMVCSMINWKQNINMEGYVNSIPYIVNVIGRMLLYV